MKTHIVLLRGVNVLGHNRLPMKSFADILAGMGFANVRTYIQSGNALIDSATTLDGGAVRRIGQEIHAVHGFAPAVLLLDGRALQHAVAANPFATDNGKALHCFFLESAPEQPDMARLQSLKAPSESFALIGLVFYLHTPDGFGRSKLAAAVESALGVKVTARNWNTIRQLTAMLGQSGAP